MKTIKAQSGHTIFVKPILSTELPKKIKNDSKHYSKFYVAKNWDDEGVPFMYLAKGNKAAPKEIVVWYAKGGFWSGYGTSIETAINGAQRDGWLYA